MRGVNTQVVEKKRLNITVCQNHFFSGVFSQSQFQRKSEMKNLWLRNCSKKTTIWHLKPWEIISIFWWQKVFKNPAMCKTKKLLTLGLIRSALKKRNRNFSNSTHTKNWQVLSFDSDGRQQNPVDVGMLSLNIVICQQYYQCSRHRTINIQIKTNQNQLNCSLTVPQNLNVKYWGLETIYQVISWGEIGTRRSLYFTDEKTLCVFRASTIP